MYTRSTISNNKSFGFCILRRVLIHRAMRVSLPVSCHHTTIFLRKPSDNDPKYKTHCQVGVLKNLTHWTVKMLLHYSRVSASNHSFETDVVFPPTLCLQTSPQKLRLKPTIALIGLSAYVFSWLNWWSPRQRKDKRLTGVKQLASLLFLPLLLNAVFWS